MISDGYTYRLQSYTVTRIFHLARFSREVEKLHLEPEAQPRSEAHSFTQWRESRNFAPQGLPRAFPARGMMLPLSNGPRSAAPRASARRLPAPWPAPSRHACRSGRGPASAARFGLHALRLGN